MAARLETSEKAAEKHIKTLDPERERFVRQNFGKDPTDVHEYDIVLSTSRLSIAECAATVIALVKQVEARAEVRDGSSKKA
jgi:cytidylate kinase